MRFSRTLLLLVLLLGLTGCSLFPKEEEYVLPVLEDPPPSRIVTYEVERGFIAEEIRGLGRVAPVLETQLYFTRPGRIKTMDVRLQQQVEEGTILAQLEIGDLEHQLKLAKISLEEARLRLERMEELALIEGRKDSPDLHMQRLAVEREQVKHDYLVEQINQATIRAPYDGVIVRTYTQAGLTVKEYEPVLTIADPSELEIHMELYSEDDFQRITPGQPVRVEVTRGNWVEGYVAQIPSYAERTATGAERDRRVRIRFQNPGVRLRMNDLMTAIIVVREKPDALLIPKAALREFMGRTYVRVLEGETRREIDVDVGIRGATHVEILDGLEEGMLVIGK
jgi:RND family efflux transporter MFP subunit